MNVSYFNKNNSLFSSNTTILLLGKNRFNIKIWRIFQDVFNCMPVAALIERKIFCCHGGLSPHLRSLDQLKRIVRPVEIQETGRSINFFLLL